MMLESNSDKDKNQFETGREAGLFAAQEACEELAATLHYGDARPSLMIQGVHKCITAIKEIRNK